ncbi:MAG: hypothetical protein Q9M13_01495 [Mariprofundales bacterium]|nr:hypothetical protein [Mariprofundales bacterium]
MRPIIALIMAAIVTISCSNSTPDNTAASNTATSTPSTPISTVAVAKQPPSHSATDLKKAFNNQTNTSSRKKPNRTVIRKCLNCHTVTSHKKVGPGLAGVYNRKAGVMPDMHYSSALQNGNWKWDESHLAAWLCDGHKALQIFSSNPEAHSKMPTQHICKPKQQAEVIAYLKTL